MAMQAENMDYDKLKELVDSLSCRSISPLVLPEVPLGSFTLMIFPMTKVEGTENPGVHYFDLIVDHADDIDFFGLSSSYKLACEKKDLALLPAPFGLKAACPKQTTIQIAILKQPDGKKAILKHVSFLDKVKVSFVQQICFGSPYRPLFMKSNPKVGRKILQYCFENLGGHAFRCFDLSAQATHRGQSKTSMPFEDKEDAEIDEGFDYISRSEPQMLQEKTHKKWKETIGQGPHQYVWNLQCMDSEEKKCPQRDEPLQSPLLGAGEHPILEPKSGDHAEVHHPKVHCYHP